MPKHLFKVKTIFKSPEGAILQSPVRSAGIGISTIVKAFPKSPEGVIPQSPVRSAGVRISTIERPERLTPLCLPACEGFSLSGLLMWGIFMFPALRTGLWGRTAFGA